jgi:hypothetical protein
MAWTENDIYVTASNPPPGRVHAFNNTVGPPGSSSDNGLGLNVYIAGGAGASGTVPVSIQGFSGSFGGGTTVTVENIPQAVASGVISYVAWSTGTQLLLPANAERAGYTIYNASNSSLYMGQISGTAVDTFTIRISAGGVYESNPFRYIGDVYGVWDAVSATSGAFVTEWFYASASSSGTSGSSTQNVAVTNWPATSSVTVLNLPATQSVSLVSPLPLQVSGNVGVVGTASVRIDSTGGPLNVSGTVAVTSSKDNPIWVTGTTLNVKMENSSINVTATIGSTVATGTTAPTTATFVGFIDPSGNMMPARVIGGAQVVTGTVTVQGISLSGSTPPEAIPNSLANIGYAVMGTSQASASWTIKRLSFDASGSLTAQEWSSPSASWSSRASEVYA